jgi:hypothetical protein
MQNPEQLQKLIAACGVAGVALAVLVLLAIGIAVCWFLSSCLTRVPAQFRRQRPELTWLLLIPCFNIVWNFFVYPKIAESFKAYFDSVGRTDVGDCGRALAMVFCILTAVGVPLGLIPLLGAILGCFLGLANLVIWILFLVKAAGLKGQIPLDAGIAPPAPEPPASQS